MLCYRLYFDGADVHGISVYASPCRICWNAAQKMDDHFHPVVELPMWSVSDFLIVVGQQDLVGSMLGR